MAIFLYQIQSTDSAEQPNLVALCKRRGFVYSSSEIYGGFSAVYDYGPYGVELKRNIATAWWRHLVQLRRDVVGLDSAIFMHPRTWEASGHTGQGFNDPLVECRACHNRMRADHVLELLGINKERAPIEEINAELDELRAESALACDSCGATDLTPARVFNLLVKSNLGSPVGELRDKDAVYLRGETCQGIYLNYRNVLDSMRVNIPFGVAQVGKAFRNETRLWPGSSSSAHASSNRWNSSTSSQRVKKSGGSPTGGSWTKLEPTSHSDR
ncbi:MAG: glycine--tRNA ligase [Thermoanaerobaculia bacterium]